MHNIKRNKKVLEYLLKQMKRLKRQPNLALFFEDFITLDIPSVDAMETVPLLGKEDEHKVFDNDSVLIETLKIVGIMEVSKDNKEFEKLMEKRTKKKSEKQEPSDFDKILKGIMQVPKPKENNQQ